MMETIKKLDAKEATVAAKKYFEQIKGQYFLFEAKEAKYDPKENSWMVLCEIKNLFDNKILNYTIIIDANTGDVKNVRRFD